MYCKICTARKLLTFELFNYPILCSSSSRLHSFDINEWTCFNVKAILTEPPTPQVSASTEAEVLNVGVGNVGVGVGIVDAHFVTTDETPCLIFFCSYFFFLQRATIVPWTLTSSDRSDMRQSFVDRKKYVTGLIRGCRSCFARLICRQRQRQRRHRRCHQPWGRRHWHRHRITNPFKL